MCWNKMLYTSIFITIIPWKTEKIGHKCLNNSHTPSHKDISRVNTIMQTILGIITGCCHQCHLPINSRKYTHCILSSKVNSVVQLLLYQMFPQDVFVIPVSSADFSSFSCSMTLHFQHLSWAWKSSCYDTKIKTIIAVFLLSTWRSSRENAKLLKPGSNQYSIKYLW